MVEVKEQSLINLAEIILNEEKKPVDLYQLFDMVIEKRGDQLEEISDLLNSFYADITSSAKFIYTGENTWDLKKHQKIELWEKDGSHYNEYSEVDDPELDERIAHQVALERAHQEMLDQRKVDAEEKALRQEEAAALKEEEALITVQDDLEEDTIDFADLDELDETFEEETKETTEEEKVETKEDAETEEEYDEFDEERYNEYMDTYEDEYDK
ncbi:DNA-directed RNA polymerase subunit delta [Liberiplasma polymorphum]|jgi:DNA-directed RNA polymerase subunit delta|uniref:DNA-directed RNA polymerase subunit delta n=1 Tax=Liberiplasma polymorphum TaxID=3374570 RepID=UPI00377650E0